MPRTTGSPHLSVPAQACWWLETHADADHVRAVSKGRQSAPNFCATRRLPAFTLAFVATRASIPLCRLTDLHPPPCGWHDEESGRIDVPEQRHVYDTVMKCKGLASLQALVSESLQRSFNNPLSAPSCQSPVAQRSLGPHAVIAGGVAQRNAALISSGPPTSAHLIADGSEICCLPVRLEKVAEPMFRGPALAPHYA